jgi:hypothetical protein
MHTIISIFRIRQQNSRSHLVDSKDAMIAFLEHQLQEAGRKEFESKLYRKSN